jgi:hypothetical protein
VKGLLSFARESLGLDLYPKQVEVLSEWVDSGRRRALLCLGRRSGKDTMMSAACIYNATMEDYTGLIPRGYRRYIVEVATEYGQAKEFIQLVRQQLENAPDPQIHKMVDWDSSTLTDIKFHNNVVIRALPCTSTSTRGMAISMLVLNEAGHMKTNDGSSSAGAEVYQALSPSTVQFGERGYHVFISTPHIRSGIFWDLFEKANDGKLDDVYLAHYPTWVMNPQISRDSKTMVAEFQSDPEKFNTEYGADWRSAASAYLSTEDIKAARRDTQTLPPRDDINYKCAIDPAFQNDKFAMGIAHKERDRIIVDGVWTWYQAGHEGTLDQVADIAKRYGIKRVRTDQFSSQSVLEGLGKRRLECEVVPWDNANKYEAFSRMKAAFSTRQISIPDDEPLAKELNALVATVTVSGLIRIAASGSKHDDRSVVIAALCDMLENDFGPIVLSYQDYRTPASIFDWGGGFLPD